MASVQDLRADSVLRCQQALVLIELERIAGNFPLGVLAQRDAADEIVAFRIVWALRPRQALNSGQGGGGSGINEPTRPDAGKTEG